ncbi:hypothetical protein EKH79_03105 [Dyella dinghuensis]|uniref:Methyltransferase n=1 Tax=Dyella dinghuensis TaxID=1920169 RepID=A0A3S0QZN7_9GAMM|nr:major capsid protein [Dyella dinghuensis]RUL66813.1 hypothetical protein EKH79_03105 [Dyella dinghuensis]
MFKKLKGALLGLVAMGPVAAFAQGTGSTTTIDPTSIVATLTANEPAIVAVGSAVIGVVALIASIRFVRRAVV